MSDYGTLAEVAVFARHLLGGEYTFNDYTKPTGTEVGTIMDRVCAVLNVALEAKGVSTPVSNAEAVEACDHFVVNRTVYELRRAYPHLGIEVEESIAAVDLIQAAQDFAQAFAPGFINMGETVDTPTSEGLYFTGLLNDDNRSDPDNTTYEQPKFKRGQWDA